MEKRYNEQRLDEKFSFGSNRSPTISLNFMCHRVVCSGILFQRFFFHNLTWEVPRTWPDKVVGRSCCLNRLHEWLFLSVHIQLSQEIFNPKKRLFQLWNCSSSRSNMWNMSTIKFFFVVISTVIAVELRKWLWHFSDILETFKNYKLP